MTSFHIVDNRVSRPFFRLGFPAFIFGFPHFFPYFLQFCFFRTFSPYNLFPYFYSRTFFPYFFFSYYFPVLFQTSSRLKSNVLKYQLVVFLVHVVIAQFMFLAEYPFKRHLRAFNFHYPRPITLLFSTN